jgi:type IV secretion system protein VirB5
MRIPIGILILTAAGPASAQMAVFDAANYGKLLQQAETELQQLKQLQSQLTQAQALYQSLNKPSNIASIATSLTQVPSPLGANVQGFANVGAGDFSSLGAASARATQIRQASSTYTPAPTTSTVQSFYDHALASSGNRAAAGQAVGEQAYAIADQRAQGLATLRDAIPAAEDARAVADLQARIAVEAAMIANDQMRLQALQMLQGSQSASATQAGSEEVAATAKTRAALFQSMHP